MPRQRLTILKIAGSAGLQTVKQVRNWTTMASPSGSFRKPVQRDINRWAMHLRENVAQPPVVFYLQYVDLWSSGAVFHPSLGSPWTTRAQRLPTASGDLFCYALPDRGRLDAALRQRLRRKSLAQEERWYVQALLDAFGAYRSLGSTAAIVVIRDVLGPCLNDEEVAKAIRDGR